MRVLYISYDGLLEPIGQSQILPYLERLSGQGVEFTLLTFEKSGDMTPGSVTFEETRGRLSLAKIRWVPLLYHRRPALLAKLYDIVCGAMRGLYLARHHQAELIHVRSYMPAMMALVARWLLRCRLLFDIRGFWVDERVEGRLWHKGAVYHVAKWIERLLYRNADAIVSLTGAARRDIERMPAVAARGVPIVVIPTCVDTERFASEDPDEVLKEQLGFKGKVVFAYIGSIGTWYALTQTVDFFRIVCDEMPSAAFLFLVRGNGSELQAQLEQCGLGTVSLVVPEVPHAQVPRWLSVASVGLAFIRPTPSKVASFPTKIGEYLAAGLPVVVSAGMEDCNLLIKAKRVGVIVRDFTVPEYRDAARRVRGLLQDESLVDRCRNVAFRDLSVAEGVKRYHAVYHRLRESGVQQRA